MSVAEIKKSVLALPPRKRRAFAQWVQKVEPMPMKHGAPLTDDDIVAMTAASWRDLDERETEDEGRKTRRRVAC
jgi:hypothetical protein